MSKNTELEQLLTKVRTLFEAEYERGAQNKHDELLALLKTGEKAPGFGFQTKRRGKRAPKGSAQKFVKRVLKAHPGSAFPDIVGYAESPIEKVIKPASVRKELQRGKEANEYVSDRGKYSLT